MVLAFCLRDPTDLFISFEIFETGVLAFECCFNNSISAGVYSLGAGLFFFPLATLFSSNRGALITRAVRSSSAKARRR